MGVLKGFLYFCAIGFFLGALAAPVGLGLLIGWKTLLFVGLPIALVSGGLGWLTLKQAAKFGVQADAGFKLQFEQTVRRLAEKNGGAVSLHAILTATGEPQPSAQAKLRELTGRGVIELDFGPNGETQYKLTPLDEARANLATMAEKTRS